MHGGVNESSETNDARCLAEHVDFVKAASGISQRSVIRDAKCLAGRVADLESALSCDSHHLSRNSEIPYSTLRSRIQHPNGDQQRSGDLQAAMRCTEAILPTS